MFENPRRGRQARNFTANAPKILDLKSSSEQLFSENWRWVPYLVKGVDQNAFDSILWLSPPTRLPLGIPIKIAIIEKNRKRAGDDGKREKAWLVRSSFSFSPASPQHKEACAEERDLVTREDPLLPEIKHWREVFHAMELSCGQLTLRIKGRDFFWNYFKTRLNHCS